MDIGEEKPAIVIEPIHSPVPIKQPTPVKSPNKEPVKT